MGPTGGRAARIGFQVETQADLPDMRRWLSDPDVAEWWGEEDPDSEATIGKYTPIFDGPDMVRDVVIRIGGLPVGHVQPYRLMVRNW